MDLKRTIGLNEGKTPYPDQHIVDYINLKLASMGCPTVGQGMKEEVHDLLNSLLQHTRETRRLLANYLPPADWRIQKFLDGYFDTCSEPVRLPTTSFILDRHGLARNLSLPPDGDEFVSEIIRSCRVYQGVLHNPVNDRRTTKGVFHVAEGGLPVPDDKKAVPVQVASQLLIKAFQPPKSLLELPFTAQQKEKARCFVSLLLRPTVCPEVPGFTPAKSMEIRFIAPGNLVSNLDFVESIFGNAGDPFLPENDAGLDVEHWTGHTGCVILAPHLTKFTKKELGLPHAKKATERQKRDGMCWEDEGELYNDGGAFKMTCRDASGVMVTVIADNYFGYCKKEVKTQISFASNLFGMVEEEHAGGALVYPSYDLGEEFSGDRHVRRMGHNMKEVLSQYQDRLEVFPEGHAVDRNFPEIVYVPQGVDFDLNSLTASWEKDGEKKSIKILPGRTYVRPSGYKVHMEKPPGVRAWRLVGTVAEGVLCHKPCTVSGGGKSEISKPITDAIIQGPVFVSNFKEDFDQVAEMIGHDYSNRFKDASRNGKDKRLILDPDRSLGSVIKLLTPAREYSDEYNDWLKSTSQHIKELVFVVKRFYKPAWGDNWREHFSVDVINGNPGNELKRDNKKLAANYLRVGFEEDGAWRVFGLRKDFHPAAKLTQEDDITASVTVPARALGSLNPDYQHQSVKFVKNCEFRLFQRPDDAVHRGYDKETEKIFSDGGNFFSNYEPLTREAAQNLMDDAIGFGQFTEPMQSLIRRVATSDGPTWFVSTAHPRLVDGVPTKNPRFLQTRPDLVNPSDTYLVEVAARLHRRIPPNEPLLNPVNAVVPGRRNNPPDIKNNIRPLAVYNPIHFMELPELFMEYICSMTGKSPSTTGAGSEGAMTKGPFNALLPIHDLNAALVSYLLTGYNAFVTAAGYVGPKMRIDHDISLLIPEVWCRMSAEERDSKHLIENGYFEKCQDFEHNGKKVLHSRIGYRMTRRFLLTFLGRVFNHPHVVIPEEMLKPELQDMDVFADGMDNIVSTQRRVAEAYFQDGSIEYACPPLKALLHIMREDRFEGKNLDHPDIRSLFTSESMLKGGWYEQRLKARQRVETRLWKNHVQYLKTFLNKTTHRDEAQRLGIEKRLEDARAMLEQVEKPERLKELEGTIGTDPVLVE